MVEFNFRKGYNNSCETSAGNEPPLHCICRYYFLNSILFYLLMSASFCKKKERVRNRLFHLNINLFSIEKKLNYFPTYILFQSQKTVRLKEECQFIKISISQLKLTSCHAYFYSEFYGWLKIKFDRPIVEDLIGTN